ncbi:hypothetical protein WA026_006751 [Henosepilachna vigintioctopunctata]|uniref:Uncharacterized protein n=1 Tax=Henosepilachna vigintioctopunctata TaxID=420089 RepID=A0AAW1UIZ3_9CUCU
MNEPNLSSIKIECIELSDLNYQQPVSVCVRKRTMSNDHGTETATGPIEMAIAQDVPKEVIGGLSPTAMFRCRMNSGAARGRG